MSSCNYTRTIAEIAFTATLLVGAVPQADAAWWWRNPARTTYYQPYATYYQPAAPIAYTAGYQPYVANYGAFTARYAPAAGAACQTCNAAPACGTCTQRVCSYVPQTAYRPVVQNVPVTSYHPVTTFDHCSGATWTSYRPVQTCVQQTTYMPYTTYRQVCTSMMIATAPACTTAAYVAPVVQAPVASPSCCGGSAVVAPASPMMPTPTTGSPTGSGSSVAPSIAPGTNVPGADGSSLLDGTRSTEAARPVYPRTGAPLSTPADTKVQPTFLTPRPNESGDRVAANARIGTAVYRPVSLSIGDKSAVPSAAPTGSDVSSIRPASAAADVSTIRPAADGRSPGGDSGWLPAR